MENRLIECLRERLPKGKRQLLGLGDDAAVLDWAQSSRCVVTSDLLAEGVHFTSDTSMERVGRKSLAVNLSDLAAMASRPVAVFISLLLPRTFSESDLQSLYDGISQLSSEFSAPIAGGDTNIWDGPLVVSVTAVGDCESGKVWSRSGGQVGDAILVSGELGGSLLGHHLDFVPRIREAQAVARVVDVHAAMDISDGLLMDLSRLAVESGCGAELDLGLIPISSAAWECSQTSDKSAREHATSDGEDFELLLCLSERDAVLLCERPPVDLKFTRIGQLVGQPGLRQSGLGIPIPVSGYEH